MPALTAAIAGVARRRSHAAAFHRSASTSGQERTLESLGRMWKERPSPSSGASTSDWRGILAVPSVTREQAQAALRWSPIVVAGVLALPVALFSAGSVSENVRMWQLVHLPMLQTMWTALFPSTPQRLQEHLAQHPAAFVGFACRSIRLANLPPHIEMLEYRRVLGALAQVSGTLERRDVQQELRKFGLSADLVAAVSQIDLTKHNV